MATEATLQDLNSRLTSTVSAIVPWVTPSARPTHVLLVWLSISQGPIPMNRFRPNIVVSGSQSLEEDRYVAARHVSFLGSVCSDADDEPASAVMCSWKRISVGPLRLHGTKRCTRCKIPCTDQVCVCVCRCAALPMWPNICAYSLTLPLPMPCSTTALF